MEVSVPAESMPPRLGRFSITRRLGRGGSGRVFQAWDPARREAVAVKLLDGSGALAFGRFKREFRALANLDHPNLIELHELFQAQGRLFFSMELLGGVGFIDWVRPGGRLDVIRLREAMRQLARATAALHAAGKLHRDIKSSNIMVTDEGRVVLFDFGFVLDPATASSLDAPGRVVGTPAYMSPEQAFGLEVGTSSDWYSIGVVLYEALTGRPPFPDRGAREQLRKRLSHDPPVPSSVVEQELPADLEALCVGLLHRVGSARPDVSAIITSLGDPLPAAPRAARALQAGAESGPLMVGRDSELIVLSDALRRVAPGRPACVFVHGPSGIGKSVLLRRFAADLRAAGRLRVWPGRCYERESIPYNAFDGVVDALVAELRGGPRPLTHLADPADVHALLRLFPALGQLDGVRETSLNVPAEASADLRDRAHTAFKRLLARLTEQAPIVITIDDLQWCDADSIALWLELLRPPHAPALLVAGTCRQDALWSSTPLATTLAQLNRVDVPVEILEIELGPLDEPLAQELATTLFADRNAGSPALASALALESRGSPLFLRELVEHTCSQPQLLEDLQASRVRPPGLEAVLLQRFARLSSAARRVLEMVAVAGHRVEQGTVLRAALGEGATPTAIDVLRRHRLVHASGFTETDEIETAHDRIRWCVLETLEPEQRRARHLALARTLQESARAQPEALATHFAEAGAHELAAVHALRAAELANEGLAFALAADWFALALAHLPEDASRRGEIEAALGHALASAGRGHEAAQAMLRAAQGADADTRRHLRRLAAHWLVYSGDLGAGRRLLVQLLRDAGLPFPGSRASAIASLLVLRARIRLRGLTYRARAEPEIPADQLHRIDLCWAVGLLLNDDPILGAAFLARHLLLALDAGDPARIAPALAYEVVARLVSGRLSAADALGEIDRAASVAASGGSEEASAWVEFVRPIVAMTAGHWDLALAGSHDAARRLKKHVVGAGLPILTCGHLESWCQFQLGNWAELPALVHRTIASGGRNNPHRGGARDLLAFPISLAADDPDRALELLGDGRQPDDGAGNRRRAPFRYAGRIFTHLYTGDIASAWAYAQRDRRDIEKAVRFSPAISRAFYLWAHAAAATAAVTAGDGRAHAAARRDIKRLSRLAFAPAPALGALAAAGLHSARGELDLASVRLRDAADAFAGLGMQMHEAIARLQLGELVGEHEGEQMATKACARIAFAGVVRPRRLARALAPGFDSLGA